MKTLVKNLIVLFSLIPFMRIFLRLLYTYALRKIANLSEDHPEIHDILLISKLDESDFVYGSSDINVVFVIKNDAHPKAMRKKIGKTLHLLWPVNMLVDLNNLPVFKENEIKSSDIRSYLVTHNPGHDIIWKSIINRETFRFSLKDQDHFSIRFNHTRKIEKQLLNPKKNILINRHWIRSFGKNIKRSIKGLIQYDILTVQPSTLWEKWAQRLAGFSLFSRRYFFNFKILSLKLIDNETPSKMLRSKENPEDYPPRLVEFCNKMLDNNIIEDIIVSPALIQLSNEKIKGKVFIKIVLGQSNGDFTTDELEDINDEISSFDSDKDDLEPKYVFNFTTYGFYKLQQKHFLFQYPLEQLYMKQNSYSFRGMKYEFEQDEKKITQAAIHYFLLQFMHFRAAEQQEKLVGSKFTKSLNIIYCYFLLLQHLKGKEFAISHSYKSIMEELSPQFLGVEPDTIVDEEHWELIRAQMLYFLKGIRDELSKEYSSLKRLQF